MMKCHNCGKEKEPYEFMSGGTYIICNDCFYKEMRGVRMIKLNECPCCGTVFTKWRFCLECGHINHRYTNKNYIGEGE